MTNLIGPNIPRDDIELILEHFDLPVTDENIDKILENQTAILEYAISSVIEGHAHSDLEDALYERLLSILYSD